MRVRRRCIKVAFSWVNSAQNDWMNFKGQRDWPVSPGINLDNAHEISHCCRETIFLQFLKKLIEYASWNGINWRSHLTFIFPEASISGTSMISNSDRFFQPSPFTQQKKCELPKMRKNSEEFLLSYYKMNPFFKCFRNYFNLFQFLFILLVLLFVDSIC